MVTHSKGNILRFLLLHSPHAFPLLLLVSLSAALPPHIRAADSSAAKALFKNPPREYSTGPLWVWNDLLTEQEIRDGLRELAGQKVKQVWVHPRPGLMTPYLSDDWFRLWKVALKEARRLDMNVWIYDENSYPSGFAGGLVPEAMPESRGRGLSLREVKPPPAWSSGMIGMYRLNDDSFQNVTSRAKAGESLPEGQYIVASEVRAGNSPWHGNRCYVNLLSPGVTEKFLELTLEPYRHEIGAEFGKRVPGVFTDEPNIRPAAGLPWSEVLAAEFQKRWGYDLLDHLPSLSRPVGDWRKVRHNYFEVLNEQFIAHWSRPYHDYCETNHLEWTGHYWDHEWPNCGGVPDNMAMYAWHQRPAIDCLMNQYAENTHAQFGNARMVRELSSVANQLGMKRTLCETYGAGGWDLRFEDMKRIGDWLEVLGVNTINQHLSYVTLRGARKRDHPQSFSYHEPWWNAYHVSAEYLARLSAALSQGDQVNRILLLEPTTSAWMYQGDGAKLKELGDSFFNLVMALEKAQVEYDIGCEDILARHGNVLLSSENGPNTGVSRTSTGLPGAGGLKVGARLYQTVVIPPKTENLNSQTATLLENFLKSSLDGEVLCLGEPPTRVDGQPANRMLELAKNPRWRRLEPDAASGWLANQAETAGFAIKRKPGDQGILFHHRRYLKDGELLFLVNTSIEAPSAGVVSASAGSVEQWDLYSGKIEDYPFKKSETGLESTFELPPSGSLLLFLAHQPRQPVASRIKAVSNLAAIAGPEVRRLQPNVLTLDYVDITASGETRTNLYCYQAGQFAWQKNGVERNPWDSAVQFKDELIARKFPAASGFEASYKFALEGAVPANLALVIERPDLYVITCNGQAVSARPNDWWLDKAFGRIAIAAAARVGQNVVTLKASPFTIFHELEPAYVLGDFTLKPADKGFVIGLDQPLRMGGANRQGWNAQGHPFYSGGVAYREQFNLDKVAGHYLVELASWYGSVAEVTVNGKPAGFIDAPSWKCDVTRWLKRGSNDVQVTVIGTLKNLLGPHHGNPPLGAAWPAGFQKGPASGPPPGAEYNTVGYGLFELFQLKQVQQ